MGEVIKKGEIIKQLLKILPLNKLTRYDVTNLFFDLLALYFTLQFALKVNGGIDVLVLWFAIVALCLVCFVWASKQ